MKRIEKYGIGSFMNRKINKIERIAIITKNLIENPSKLFTLHDFTEKFGCAKSTISEDVKAIEQFFGHHQQGQIYSVSGAAGGIYYLPTMLSSNRYNLKEELCKKLANPSRIISGGYVYMNDILYDPEWLRKMAICMVADYTDQVIDYVVTIETKGIPLALAIANLINRPIVVVRKAARLTEGTTIQTNYVSGSKKTIKTMALPIQSIQRGSHVLFVDDVMKAGGTAKGIIDLMKAFEVHVVGISVMMVMGGEEKKLIDTYHALVDFVAIDEAQQTIHMQPHKE